MSLRHAHINPTHEEAFPKGYELRRRPPPPTPIVTIRNVKPPEKVITKPVNLFPSLTEAQRRANVQRAREAALEAQRLEKARKAEEKRRVLAAAAEAEFQRWRAKMATEQAIEVNNQTFADVARQIMRETCAKHGLVESDVCSHQKRVSVVAARQEVMFRIRTETPWSFTRIGRFMNRDWTTVIHGVRKHQERVDLAFRSEGAPT